MADSEELNSMLKPYKRELQFKFVFLGDYGVGKSIIILNKFPYLYFRILGKTSIIKRYSEGNFAFLFIFFEHFQCRAI